MQPNIAKNYECRSEYRVPLLIPVNVYLSDQSIEVVQSINLSKNGMAYTTPYLIDVGAILEYEFVLRIKGLLRTVRTQAIVQHKHFIANKRLYFVGIKFIWSREDMEKNIAIYVSTKKV